MNNMDRCKVIVAVRDSKGNSRLFSFTDESKADSFITEARMKGFEVIKGKPK